MPSTNTDVLCLLYFRTQFPFGENSPPPPYSVEDTAASDETESVSSRGTSNLEYLNVKLLTGSALIISQVKGLLYKRWKHAHRDWRFILSAIGLPTLLMILCMCLAMIRPGARIPPLLLTPSIYGPFSHSFIR